MRQRIALGLACLAFVGILVIPRVMSGQRRGPQFIPLSASTSSAPLPVLSEKNKALWLTTDGKTTQIAPSSHYDKATRGSQTCYAILDTTDRRSPAIHVLRADSHGRMTSQFRFRDERIARATAIMGVQWVAAQRLFVDLHVGPSRGVGLTVDLQTGQSQTIDMTAFKWSDQGNHLAYVLDAPARSGGRSELFVDGVKVVDVTAGSWRALSWTGESDFRLTTTGGAKPVRVTIDRTTGQPKIYTPPPQPRARSTRR